MSQPTVTSYFNTRKRQACDDLRGKSKVLLLERDHASSPTLTSTESSEQTTPDVNSSGTSPKIVLKDVPVNFNEDIRAKKVVRNIQFDSPKATSERTSKPRTRVMRPRTLASMDGQADIRDSLLKIGSNGQETKTVLFEKKGTLSPKKKKPQTPKKNLVVPNDNKETVKEQDACGSLTPSLSRKNLMMQKLANDNLGLYEIKNRINKSSRLMELKASMQRIMDKDKTLKQLEQKQNDAKKPQIQKFEKIELEVPVSPKKGYKSPIKALVTPTKNKDLLKTASPQRRMLFEPKEKTPSPAKSKSPLKAYERYSSLAETEVPALTLPYNYRFLAEIFRCVETVSAMLFNRKELITFNKLKPAVQELLRRNFTQDHLAQIKTIYPDAYTFHQEKHRNFGSVSKQEKYELVLMPLVETNNGRNTPDADNVLKTASDSSMNPTLLLQRRKKFYNILLERVKDEHEKFLLSFDTPRLTNIPREKIVRWHPEFDVESCKEIDKAELPQPIDPEKRTAKDVLDKAKSLFNCGTRMEKALQKLAEANLTSKSKSPPSVQNSSTQTKDNVRQVNIAIVDTPPTTPSTQNTYIDTLFKGIPKALLEKVRAKQAAKALEAMTRTPTANKEAALYFRLPELAKLLRNIFVAEKKGVLPVETVIQKLDNSFRTKLTPQETEEHIRHLCKLLPTWSSLHNVRKVNYMKLDRNVELAKVIKRLEILANDKIKITS